MRLTKKENGKYYTEERAGVLEIIGVAPSKFVGNDITKLGQLEDIEEELGIDLITLFKALEKGIVVCCNNTFGGERNVFILLTPDRLSIEYKWKCLRKGTQKFYFKDYGKTWALTKEELL